MGQANQARATVMVEIESTQELADQVREHITAQVATALASDKTMLNYVTRALTRDYPDPSNPTYTKKGDGWLRDVIDQSIREAAVEEVNRQVTTLEPILKKKVRAQLDTHMDDLVERLVNKLAVAR